jgi:hypothetical protein
MVELEQQQILEEGHREFRTAGKGGRAEARAQTLLILLAKMFAKDMWIGYTLVLL